MQIAWSGIGIVEGIGLIGGTQFSRNRTGNTASMKTIPRIPKTVSQQTAMTNYRTVLQHWRELTNAQRIAWDAAATDPFVTRKNRVGVAYQPTGQSLFVECNLNAYDTNFPIVTPEAFPTWTAITATALTIEGSTAIALTMSTATIAANEGVTVFATAPLSPGQMSLLQPNLVKLKTFFQGDMSDPLSLYDSYEPIWGDAIQGQKIFVQTWLLDKVGGYKTDIGAVAGIYN